MWPNKQNKTKTPKKSVIIFYIALEILSNVIRDEK